MIYTYKEIKYSLWQSKSSNKKKKGTFQVRIYNPETNKRSSAKSTKQTSIIAAQNWVQKQIDLGTIQSPSSGSTFGVFAKDFWIYNKCSYVQSKIDSGSPLSKAYCQTNRNYLEKYFLPVFKSTPLKNITISMIEDIIENLKKHRKRDNTGYSLITIKNIMKVFKAIINEAYRLDLIEKNPIEKLRKINGVSKKRGILEVDEIRKLINPSSESIQRNWDNDIKIYTISLTAITTGLRMGECQALQKKDVGKTEIKINHSWARKFGLKLPKNNKKRIVPITSTLSFFMEKLKEGLNDDDFIFLNTLNTKPIDNSVILQKVYKALDKINISAKERKIVFHSFRHGFISHLRLYFSDIYIQNIVGHATQQKTVTDMYTHNTNEINTKISDKISELYFY